MAVTNVATVQSARQKYWVTDAAVNNYRERTSAPATLGADKLVALIDNLVHQAIESNPTAVENITDIDEEARLVRISDDPLYALVKKSNNHSAPFAVVTVMSAGQVEKKKVSGQWKMVFGALSSKNKNKMALLAVKPVETPKTVPAALPISEASKEAVKPEAKRGMYLIMYRARIDGTSQQFLASSDDVTGLINSVNAVPGTIEVFKRLEVGLHIIE